MTTSIIRLSVTACVSHSSVHACVSVSLPTPYHGVQSTQEGTGTIPSLNCMFCHVGRMPGKPSAEPDDDSSSFLCKLCISDAKVVLYLLEREYLLKVSPR
jgi:hypothetical protein